jgi:hydroxymethylpyrimidine/phosphomethylpyrimidine kinase
MSESGYARILIVGGHDSSGGAGIDADHESVRDLPIEPIVVATAFTIQDDRGVQSIGAREPNAWMREARELVEKNTQIAEHRGERADSNERAVKLDREIADANVLAAKRDRELADESDLAAKLDRAITETSDPAVKVDRARADAHVLAANLDSELADVSLHAVKFGLLPGAEHMRAAVALVSNLRREIPKLPVVVDPVITSSSGTRFLDRAALDALRNEVIAVHIVLTPNLAEAAELASMPLAKLVHEPESRIEAARKLLALGAAAVIVKAGHGTEDPARDLIAARGEPIRWVEHARIRGGKIRGSGCRFATRLAAHLALGRTLEAGAREAGEHVARQIRERSA